MSKVSDEIKVAQELVSTVEGTFAYLKGAVLSRIRFWYDRMQELNGYSDELMSELIKDYVGVKLSPAQCANVQGILGLQSLVTASADAGNMSEFEAAWEKGTLSHITIKEFQYAARKRIAIDIVHAYKKLASDESGGKEVKVQALVDFGIPREEAERYQWSGSTVSDQAGRGVNFYALAGLIMDYPDLLGPSEE